MEVPVAAAPQVAAPNQYQELHRISVPQNAFGQDVGAALNQAGNTFAKVAIDQQNLQNEAEARDLTVQAETQIGAEGGRLKELSGKDAIDYNSTYVKNINDIRTGALAAASNPAVSKLVDAQVARSTANALIYGQGHIGQQTGVYNRATLKADMQLSQDKAASAQDETAFQREIQNVKDTIPDQMPGSPDAAVQLAIKEQVGAVYAKRLLLKADTDPLAALQALNEHRDDMLGDQAMTLQKQLQDKALTVSARVNTGKIMAGSDVQTPEAREQYGYAYYAAKYGRNGSAGIMGNASHESAGTYSPTTTNPGDQADGSASQGAFQWDKNRYSALKDFASALGTSPDDYKTQIKFAEKEIDETPGLADKLRQAKTPEEASAIFALKFERPAGAQTGDYSQVSGAANRTAQSNRIGSQSPQVAADGATTMVQPTANWNQGIVFGKAGPTSAQTATTDAIDGNVKNGLASLRQSFGQDITVTSTTEGVHAPNSQHYAGKAVDLSIKGMDDATVSKLITSARAAGFTGFGIGNTHLHLDMRDSPDNSTTVFADGGPGTVAGRDADSWKSQLDAVQPTTDNGANAARIAKQDPVQASTGYMENQGPGQLERLENQARDKAKTSAELMVPGDTGFSQRMQDAYVDNVRKLYTNDKAVRQDSYNANINTVQGAIFDDASKTKSLDDFKTDPKFASAFEALPAKEQMLIRNHIATASDHREMTFERTTRFNELVGSAKTEPAQFLKDTQDNLIAAEDLPLAAKSTLNKLRAQVVQDAAKPPQVSAAMNVLQKEGYFQGVFKTNTPKFNQFYGALEADMQAYKSANKKDPAEADIKDMATGLLRQHSSGGWFGGSVAAFTDMPSPDVAASIQSYYGAKNPGEPPLSSMALMQAYKSINTDMPSSKIAAAIQSDYAAKNPGKPPLPSMALIEVYKANKKVLDARN